MYVTNTDDDTATADLSVTQHGDEDGPVHILYTATLSEVNDTGAAITFDLDDLLTGTATSGSDYAAVSANTQISVAPGASTGTLTVPVNDDALPEDTETLIAMISNSSNPAVTIDTASATANITDNDIPTANVTITGVNGSGNPNRSGIRELTFNFDQPVTVASATSLNLSHQATGQDIDLSGATLSGNGTNVVTWNLLGVTLPDGIYTAELSATATTPNLTQTHAIQFSKLFGDVSGDGVVSFSDYTAVQADFGASFGMNNNEFRPGDANGDGVVSFGDYTAVQANFGGAADTAEFDFGDAPDSAGPPTAAVSDGARHVTTGNALVLDTSRDSESDGESSAGVDGDDASPVPVVAPDNQRQLTESQWLNAPFSDQSQVPAQFSRFTKAELRAAGRHSRSAFTPQENDSNLRSPDLHAASASGMPHTVTGDTWYQSLGMSRTWMRSFFVRSLRLLSWD